MVVLRKINYCIYVLTLHCAVGKLDCLQELDCQASLDTAHNATDTQKSKAPLLSSLSVKVDNCLDKRRWLVAWDMDKVWTFNINSNSLSFFMYCYRYANRPIMSVPGLYDPTEVMNATEMTRCQREGWIKLTFYLLSFFYYLYRWVSVMWLEMQVNR